MDSHSFKSVDKTWGEISILEGIGYADMKRDLVESNKASEEPGEDEGAESELPDVWYVSLAIYERGK
jgi:hypothetical protein